MTTSGKQGGVLLTERPAHLLEALFGGSAEEVDRLGRVGEPHGICDTVWHLETLRFARPEQRLRRIGSGGTAPEVAANETGASFQAEPPEQRNPQADHGPAAIRREHLDRPITDIALDLGVSEASAVSRVFRSRLGLSPIRYRHQKGRREALRRWD